MREETFLRVGCRWAVAWNNVVMERVFDVRRFVGSAIQSTEVGVILCKEKLGLNWIDVWIHFEICRGANWRWRGEAIKMGFAQGGVPSCDAVNLVVFGATD